MIARETKTTDLWSKLAAPILADLIEWRQDGKAVRREGEYFARFVPYISANTARSRLDSVVPGEWDLTLEVLPPIPTDQGGEATVSFKARLQILGVIREDVGTGRDYKSASSDAFKRAAVRFGIANELYDYPQVWVPVSGEDRNAKPLESPRDVYARRFGNGGGSTEGGSSAAPPAAREPAPARPQRQQETRTAAAPADEHDHAIGEEQVACPKCGGKMWDNRLSKRNPKAPDFKCRDRSCDGVIWPPRQGGRTTPVDNDGAAFPGDPGHNTLDSSPLGMSPNDIPF